MPALLQRGAQLGEGLHADRWTVIRKLGEGQFAEVYEVSDALGAEYNGTNFALKIEKRRECKTVKQEFKVMQQLAGRCSQVCGVMERGEALQGRFFMIMELLGSSNLAHVTKRAGGSFDAETASRIGRSTLQAIEQIHRAGYVHRDIKPANFAPSITSIRSSSDAGSYQWKVIDFGLARRFVGEDGAHLRERRDAAFRGSTTYASVHAHKEQDLARRDDLWSWIYMLVEMLEGQLPWRSRDREYEEASKDADLRESTRQQKQACLEEPSRLMRSGAPVPDAVVEMCRHVRQLAFEDEPDYALLFRQLDRLAAGPSARRPALIKGSSAPSVWPPAWAAEPSSAGPEPSSSREAEAAGWQMTAASLCDAEAGRPPDSRSNGRAALPASSPLFSPLARSSGEAGGLVRGRADAPMSGMRERQDSKRPRLQSGTMPHPSRGSAGGPPGAADAAVASNGRGPAAARTDGGRAAEPSRGPSSSVGLPPPASAGHARRQVSDMHRLSALLREGKLSRDAAEAAQRLGNLGPVDALAAIALTLDVLTASASTQSGASSTPILRLLDDVSAYASDCCRRSRIRNSSKLDSSGSRT